jgi:hypothetical protein
MRIRTIVAWIVGIAIFIWIGRALYSNWSKISFEELEFNYVFLVLSAVSHIVGYAVASLAWKYNLQLLGEHITYHDSFEILSLTRLGRYIPGKVWFAMGRAYFAKVKDVPQRTVFVSIILEMILQFWAVILLFLVTGAPSFEQGPQINPYILIAILLLALVAIHPVVFKRTVNFLLTKFRRETIDFDLSFPKILALLLLFFLVFLLQGCGFLFLVRSFYPVQVAAYPVLVGVFALAWLIGFLSFVTPAGLGIREGVLSLLLRDHLPTGLGIIAALLSRIWLTIVEVFLFLFFVRNLKKYV